MSVQTRGPLKASNAKVANLVRTGASLDYRSRIPEATQANIQQVAESLYEYKPAWNEFIHALVNRIGEVVVRDQVWDSPMSVFKGGMLGFGDTIEEVQVGLIEARVYDPDSEYLERDLFGTYRPHVESNFHTVNRQNYYPITINENLLKRAFLEAGGLSKFITALMNAPANSDALDEFKVMTNLFKTYERNGGFFHVNIPDVKNIDSDSADAKRALRTIVATAENLTFWNTGYNAAKMPTFSTKSKMVLFCTPEFKAAIDIEALAAAFNLDKISIPDRIITIPEEDFGIPGCQAILTDDDFFIVRDALLENTSQPNPVGLSTNYYLHHWQVISASRFVNAVMFTSEGGDVLPTAITKAPKSIGAITVEDENGKTDTVAVDGTGTIQRGAYYRLSAPVTTDAPDGSQALVWSIVGNTSNRTRISETGVLSPGWDEKAAEISVTARAVGFNEDSLRDDAPSKTVKFLIGNENGEAVTWPAGGKPLALVYGDDVRIPLEDGKNAYELTSSLTKWTGDEVANVHVESVGGVSVTKTVAGKVLTLSIDPAYGKAPRVVTLTLTAPAA